MGASPTNPVPAPHSPEESVPGRAPAAVARKKKQNGYTTRAPTRKHARTLGRETGGTHAYERIRTPICAHRLACCSPMYCMYSTVRTYPLTHPLAKEEKTNDGAWEEERGTERREGKQNDKREATNEKKKKGMRRARAQPSYKRVNGEEGRKKRSNGTQRVAASAERHHHHRHPVL